MSELQISLRHEPTGTEKWAYCVKVELEEHLHRDNAAPDELSRESELLWKRTQFSGFVRHHSDVSITTLSPEANSM